MRFGQREVEAVAGRASGKKYKLLWIRKLPPSNAQLLPRCPPDQPCAAGRSLCGFAPHTGLPLALLKAAAAGETPRCRFSVILLASLLYLRKEHVLAGLD